MYPSSMPPSAAPASALADLKDIHLPQPSPWWDIAWGWWLLLVLMLVFVVWGLPKLVQWWRVYQQRKQLKHNIAHEFAAICANYASTQDVVQFLSETNTFLRRVVLSQHKNTQDKNVQVAGLIGQAWLAYLDGFWQKGKPSLSFTDDKIMHLLLHDAYQTKENMEQQAVSQEDVIRLQALVQDWLKIAQKTRGNTHV